MGISVSIESLRRTLKGFFDLYSTEEEALINGFDEDDDDDEENEFGFGGEWWKG